MKKVILIFSLFFFTVLTVAPLEQDKIKTEQSAAAAMATFTSFV